MMNGMMDGSGGMMWGMGLFWVLVLIFLLMGIAAFAKYLFFDRRSDKEDTRR